MKSAPALALLAILLVPQTASAAFALDPVGDETFAPGRVVFLPTTCHDPMIDILAVGVSSDGTHATINMTVLDLAGQPTCANGLVPIEGRWGFWWVVLTNASGAFVAAYAQEQGDGSILMRYDLGGGSSVVSGSAAGSISGNVLTWVVPLSGALPGTGAAYDYRGVTFGTQVEASRWASSPDPRIQDVFNLYDRADLGSVTV
jgi:hypothetical protein